MNARILIFSALILAGVTLCRFFEKASNKILTIPSQFPVFGKRFTSFKLFNVKKLSKTCWPALSSLLFTLLFSSCAGKPIDAKANEELAAPASPERYGLKTSHAKRTDNQGAGDENLYGTRNVRAVLKNAIYRGGANNVKNRYGSRPNSNPLPVQGLQSLCKEGFDTAVYMYSEGYAKAPKEATCVDRHTGKPNKLEYLQVGPYNDKSVRELLELAYRKAKLVLNGETPAPAYYHCWNGWHASGMMSAFVLRQFCDYSGAEAVAYWDLNTDGNNKDPNFKKLRARMQNFKPYADLKLTADEQAKLCLPMK